MSIEKEVKNNFSKIFTYSDWKDFKSIAEYYFKTAANLKNDDISTSAKYKLRIRNIQKRLFLGIGSELILKAYYLKRGYSINRWKSGRFRKPVQMVSISKEKLDSTNTITINQLIQNLGKVSNFDISQTVNAGFRISKVFRNKEAHITVPKHEYNPEDYDTIESCIMEFFKKAFNEKLAFQISMEANKKGKFKIK